MKRTLIAGTGFCLLAAAAGAVCAAPKMHPAMKMSSTMKRGVPAADKNWMAAVAQDGMTEVAAGKFMATHGQNPAIRAFGKRMVIDHTRAGDKLMRIAADQGVMLPKTMGAKNRQECDAMMRMSGAARDRAYITHMVSAHVGAIALFEKEAGHGQDAAVRDFAKRTLPTLRVHLALAKSAAAKVGAMHGKAPARM